MCFRQSRFFEILVGSLKRNKTTRIERRAIKTGLRTAKRQGRALSDQEVRNLKVQLISPWVRIGIVVTGIALLVAGVSGYPIENQAVQIAEGIVGVLMIIGGLFGVRRTLSRIVDNIEGGDAADIMGVVIEGIGAAIGSVLDV